MRTWTLPLSGLSIATAAVVAIGCGGDAVACKGAKQVQAEQLLSGVPDAYKVQKMPEADARELLQQFPKETRDDIAGINGAIAIDGEKAVVVYALTSANERLDPEEELKGFRESAEAETEELEVGGEKGLLQTVPDGTLAIGTAGDCGAVLVISEDEKSVRDVAKVLQPPKD
jgi:hypothetical protein